MLRPAFREWQRTKTRTWFGDDLFAPSVCKCWPSCLLISFANICVIRTTMEVSRAAIVESLLWPVPPKMTLALQRTNIELGTTPKTKLSVFLTLFKGGWGVKPKFKLFCCRFCIILDAIWQYNPQHKCSKPGGWGVKGHLDNVKKTDNLVLGVVP